jgi:hypothetical protein
MLGPARRCGHGWPVRTSPRLDPSAFPDRPTWRSRPGIWPAGPHAAPIAMAPASGTGRWGTPDIRASRACTLSFGPRTNWSSSRPSGASETATATGGYRPAARASAQARARLHGREHGTGTPDRGFACAWSLRRSRSTSSFCASIHTLFSIRRQLPHRSSKQRRRVRCGASDRRCGPAPRAYRADYTIQLLRKNARTWQER